MYNRKIRSLERQKQLELSLENEKSYKELTAAKDNFKLFEIENKATQHKIQPASDISTSKKDFVDNLEQHTSNSVTGSHKEDTTKNPSQYFKIFIEN